MPPSPTVSAPARPTVRGQLSVTSLPELLVLALDRKLHGSIVIKTPSSTKSAFFLDSGRVTKVRTAEPVEPLGRLLMTSGAIDRATLDAALHLSARHRDPLGASLIQLRAVPAPLLDATLAEQLARRVAWLGSLPASSIFGYYAGVDYLRERPSCSADPLALIWRCVRDGAAGNARQESMLAALERRPLRLHAEATPERFDLSPDELALADAMRTEPQQLAAAPQAFGIDEGRARRLVYALALTRHLDLGRAERPVESVPPPKPSSTARPAAPSAAPPQPAAMAPESVTPVAMPPSRRPTAPAIPAVRRSAAPRSGNLHSSPAVDRIEHALERAARSSAHPEAPPSPERNQQAVRAFEAAQQCVSRKQFERADGFARQACEADPMSAEYLALHAWLRMQLGDLSHPLRSSEIVAWLDRAVMKERESTSIRFYRAQVLKRLGRDDDAYRDFRFVARRKPDHLDAVREVRLYEMRLRNQQKNSSVLSKLFLR
jgi:tetratricopeptide (TPR) repeat protein